VEENETGGVENVLSDEILADAQRQAEEKVRQATEESRALADKSFADARAECARMLADADHRITGEREVSEAALLLEQRMRRLRIQGGLIEEALAQGAERLRQRKGFDYVEVVKDLAVEGVLAMPGDAFVLRLAKADADAMKGHLPQEVSAGVRQESNRTVQVKIAEVPAHIDGGVIVESADGRSRIDHSFAGRIHRADDVLRFEIADILFGKAEDESLPTKEKTS
jgi:V/A-type H+-transporting ATPase subunit E